MRVALVPLAASLLCIRAPDGPLPVGDVAADLPFVTLDGARGRLSDFVERDAVVVVVRELSDPRSAAIAPALAELEAALREKSVAFLHLDATGRGDAEALRAEAKGSGATVVRDLPGESGRLGSGLGVTSATQALVLDARRRLRYRGAAIDAASHLKAAIDAVLARQRVETAECEADGAPLSFPAPAASEPAPKAPTWNDDVAPLARARCQRCHRVGGGGPFPLLEPQDFAGRESMVRRVIVGRVMPPWFASPHSAAFRNDTRLNDDERRLLLRWIQEGCPEGEPRAAPPPPLPGPGEWSIPKPDLVFELAKEYRVPASGVIPYVSLPSDFVLEEPVWVQAIEVMPRFPAVVHHLALIATDEKGRQGELVDGYLPGKEATIYPEGTAKLLPKGTRFLFSVHFTPNGTACAEKIRVGIVTAKTPPKRRVTSFYVTAPGFTIPPGQKDYVVRAEGILPVGCEIVRLVPHMHLRGKSFAIDLELPDRTKSRPLEIGRWDPGWQFAYDLAQPIAVPAGTIVGITATFDNSPANPFNPDPTKSVYEGPQIFNEMAQSIIEYVVPVDPPSEPPAGGR